MIISHSPGTPLSDEIISISIDQVPFDDEDKNYIVCEFSGSYDLYNVEDIQTVLNRKEARVTDYKKQCTEVWLLVVGGLIYPRGVRIIIRKVGINSHYDSFL